MYAFLNGTVDAVQNDSVILDVNGVGFAVCCDTFTRAKCEIGKTVKLYTYMQVRTDAFVLFGFLDLSSKSMFESLISISGLGPKSAVNILSVLRPDEILMAIMQDNPKAFKGITGVGPKMIGRILLEMKTKLKGVNTQDMDSEVSSMAMGEISKIKQACEALTGLGFTYNEAMKAIKNVDKPEYDVEELILKALKQSKS